MLLFMLLAAAAAPVWINSPLAVLGPVAVTAFLAWIATAVAPANFGTTSRR
jgi:hypothetical protein